MINVFIGNCSQLYQFIKKNSTNTYELILYYKFNNRYEKKDIPSNLPGANIDIKNMSKNTADKLILYIKLYKSLPTRPI